jgi:hypothetical protein
MQDEIIKHSLNILNKFKDMDQSFISKAKEIGVEIFIIVFAVSFSIWLHSIKEYKREQKEVRMFYTNIKEDLEQDIKWLKSDVEEYEKEEAQLNGIFNLSTLKIDSLEQKNVDITFPMHLFMNKINNGNYEGFKSSGKIGYIENEGLKKAILNYYQQDALNIVEMNYLHNQYLIKTLDSFEDVKDEKDLLNQKIQVKIKFLSMIAETNIKFCNESLIKKAEGIIINIDKELLK